MSRIRVLPEAVAARIAAGEVVERPASVVKELVENALDAGARRVDVALEDGGKRLIRVVDDGCGMDRDDALLAFEQHATSKVGADFDLAGLTSYGFRGEALAAIGACARVVLVTAEQDGTGTRVRFEHGKLRDVADVGAPRGTSIEVTRLFAELPARRKFLRSSSTELSHALRFLEVVALARADVHVTLVHGERSLLETPPVADVAARVAQLLGREFAEGALPVEGERAGVSVRGWLVRGGVGSGRFGQATLVVNGRAITDRTLSHAVREAGRALFGHDANPGGVLLVDVPPGDVDVNVHPAKREVRFARPWEVHDAVRDIVRGQSVQRGFFGPALDSPSGDARLASGPPAGYRGAAAADDAATAVAVAAPAAPAPSAPAAGVPPPGPQPWLHDRDRAAAAALAPGSRRAASAATPFGQGRRVLGQHRNTYVIAEDEHGLVLIDQHCAHERILFERLIARVAEGGARQGLLQPVVVELPRSLAALVEERLPDFARLGLEVEPFGDGSFAVGSVPEAAGAADPAELLRELAAQDLAASEPAERVHRLAATVACKAAVKAGQPLSHERQRWIADELFRTDTPTTCPHGRVAVLRLSDRDLDQRFGRTWSGGQPP